MIQKVMLCLLCFLLYCDVGYVEEKNEIEIFHIEKSKMIQKVPMTDSIQQKAETILKGNLQISRKFEPIPKSGYMIKLPLEPAIAIRNETFNNLISESIFIIPTDDSPSVLLFDDENNPYFFVFESGVEDILTELKLKR